MLSSVGSTPRLRTRSARSPRSATKLARSSLPGTTTTSACPLRRAGTGRLRSARVLHVGEHGEHAHEVGDVAELRQAGDEPVVGAFGGELEAGDLGGEVRRPRVEVVDAGGAQAVGCGVVLHHPHLRQRVGDRGGGGEGDDLGPVLLAQPLQPDVELAGVAGPGLAERRESGRDGQVLGVVGLVDEQVVDAGLFEGGAVVLVGAVQQLRVGVA